MKAMKIAARVAALLLILAFVYDRPISADKHADPSTPTLANSPHEAYISAGYREGFPIESNEPDYLPYYEPSLNWNTFLGAPWNDDYSRGSDYGGGITLDDSRNVYVTGYSDSSWGTPLSGNSGMVVAKLSNSGALQWHTFLGEQDRGSGIANDGSGYLYVTGWSSSTWGNPLNPHSSYDDTLVAKLSKSGELQWHTFLGGIGYDVGAGIALDGSGNVYVAGHSTKPWGNPLSPFSESSDIVVAKLSSSGELQWHTFLGGKGNDLGAGIALDASGSVFVTGYSDSTWGTPLNPFSGGNDIVLAKLGSSGELQWHTFVGDEGDDRGAAVALDGNGNVYVTGGEPFSSAWGGRGRMVVAKLNSSGTLQWSKILSGEYWCDHPYGESIAVNQKGKVYVTGQEGCQGVHAWATVTQIVVAAFDGSGALEWKDFFGSEYEYGQGNAGTGIAVDENNDLYITGQSNRTWGVPVNPHQGFYDIIVAKIGAEPSPLYRFYNTQTGGHFYTISAEERDWIINTYPQFNYEGPAFYVYKRLQEGTSAVYRFYNTRTGGHFYTASEDERDWILITYPHFNYEGPAFYVYKTWQEGTSPVYRFFNTQTNAHFYTFSEDERDWIIITYPQFNYEGPAFYVYE